MQIAKPLQVFRLNQLLTFMRNEKSTFIKNPLLQSIKQSRIKCNNLQSSRKISGVIFQLDSFIIKQWNCDYINFPNIFYKKGQYLIASKLMDLETFLVWKTWQNVNGFEVWRIVKQAIQLFLFFIETATTTTKIVRRF